MKKSLMRMTLLSAISLAVASCTTTQLVTPCDVLIDIPTLQTTNAYLVKNDRNAAVGIARNQGRVKEFKCGGES